ncbi:MAG TPA: ATP-binding protein [Solirubrobacteraceae bacterium]|nr:ATP-binding protein [Solirubrobacteraceae bacterium]
MPCDPSAPKLARDALRAVPELAPMLDDLLVIVSELVTNSVMHSGCSPDESIILHATSDGRRIRIAVDDPGRSDLIPQTPPVPPPHGGGLGLRLVDGLAHRWGVDRPEGCRVWAELPAVCG